jgi:uncharacterized protein
MRRFNLRSLSFGERNESERRFFVDVEPFRFGGIEYDVAGGGVELTLSVTRVGSRLTLHGRGVALVTGPCQRCLNDATVEVPVSCDDYVAGGRSEGADDERYVEGYVLDLAAWVRDALAEALPPQILCTAECRGLCAVCGANLNEAGEGHSH